MSDLDHLREIDRVLSGGRIERDAFVAQSWRRCVEQYGMDPSKPSPPHIVTETRLREHVEQSERLITIARSGLDALFRQIAGRNYVLLLADAKGVTVDYFGDPRFEDGLRRAGLYLGADWSEDVAGTCGIGSCIVTRQAITVHQSDHFDLTHTPLSCTAAPIFDTQGQLAAVLDISLLRSPQPKISQSLALHMVKASVRRVEMANLMAENRGEWVLRFSASPEFLDVDPEAAVALDGSGRITGMTHAAETLLARGGGPVLGQRIDQLLHMSIDNLPDLMRDRPTQDRLITMRDGQAIFGHAIAPQTPRAVSAQTWAGRNIAQRPAPFRSLAGKDPAMERVIAQASRLALARVPVLIVGETGTGKEKLARAIHMANPEERAFVVINGTAGPLTEGGTDPVTWADGCTLLLDNPDALSPTDQGRLLDWLMQADARPARARPRLLTTVCADLGQATKEGRFRADLFFRLAGARLDVPPLRLRQDFDWLLDRLLRQAVQARPGPIHLTPAARAALQGRNWPGNIRELAHTLDVAVLLAESSVIDLHDLPDPPFAAAPPPESLADLLRACDGNMSLAARRLGVNRSTILRRARREGLAP